MKSVFLAVGLLITSFSVWAAPLPGLVQIRVYKPNQKIVNEETGLANYSLIDEETGLSISRSEIATSHSTIYDFANEATLDAKDNSVLNLYRVDARAGKTYVGAINFADMGAAVRFQSRLVGGGVMSLTFPYNSEEDQYAYAGEVIVRSRK